MPTRWPRLPKRTTSSRLVAVVIVAMGAAACASSAPTPATPAGRSSTPSSTQATESSPSAAARSVSPSGSSAVSAAPGPFAFSGEAVIDFYAGAGLACDPATPSTTAAGWTVRTCQGTTEEGRPVAVGLISDRNGTLGAGFASVTAHPHEELLEPTDALDALAGFLGAMLGEAPANEQLPWLAAHLGDEYAETTVGDVTVATYIESPDDPTRIYLEIDGPEYLDAPPPD